MVLNAAVLAQYGQMAQLETFLMSNISPQHRDLNRGIWANLEEKVREELSPDDTNNKEVHSLYVLSGPIFEKDPPDKLPTGIPIPTSFYKIIAFRKGFGGTVKAIALKFLQHPESNDLSNFITTVYDIEQLTSFNFFPELSATKQDNLESVKRNFTLADIN